MKMLDTFEHKSKTLMHFVGLQMSACACDVCLKL